MIKKEFYESFDIPKNTAFVDIETSGLSPINDDILIISIAKFFDDKKVKILQIISQNDEKEVLIEFLTSIIGIYEIYSFNGYEFEEKFINQKLQKYDIYYDLGNINFIFIKNILKNYSNFINLKHFSRQAVENHFNVERDRYYDMKLLIKDMKKKSLNPSESFINHNIDEIHTLLQLYKKIYDFQYSNKAVINNTHLYIYNFEISKQLTKLYFKSDKKYKFSNFFMQNGEKLIIFQNNIQLEIFTKTLYEQNDSIILYETENEYIPIFIKNDIIYKNIYYILSIYLKYIK
ncbi:MAG: ribonuclease H-like domain-containing protein [Peptoanaerobacter stomatis]|uniref:ribonuclease H-like domain-containing protein n=1 Tax=Peptoanaerobacter stomatis TaxID=796937 RepID=UPI003F9F6EBD